MVDPISSLSEQLRNDAFADAHLTIAEVHPFSLIQIATWPDMIAQAGAFVASLEGCPQSPRPSRAETGPNGSLLRVESLKFWHITENPASKLPDLPNDLGAALDLSHSRAWIRISGEKAETLLNHFLPLDLRDGAFPIGTVASTAFHHVGVTLWRDERGYNLLIPRSFANSLFELLTESANQYRHIANEWHLMLSCEGPL